MSFIGIVLVLLLLPPATVLKPQSCGKSRTWPEAYNETELYGSCGVLYGKLSALTENIPAYMGRCTRACMSAEAILTIQGGLHHSHQKNGRTLYAGQTYVGACWGEQTDNFQRGIL